MARAPGSHVYLLVLLIGVSIVHAENRCGRTWSDAVGKCGVKCPSGQSTFCPSGEKCYASLPACPSSSGSSPTQRCGSSWSNANSRCGTQCPNGQSWECPSGQTCYKDLADLGCSGSGGGSTPTPRPSSTGTPRPTATPTSGSADNGETHRLVAFVENWKACPSDSQIRRYTHVLVSFAVSYTWAPAKNRCSSTCSVSTPPVCSGGGRSTIRRWQGYGVKVLLSFGGAGMGGSWAGDNNDCWEACFGRARSVASRVASIVRNEGYDGVDIDYEYHLTKSTARDFVRDLSLELRSQLPSPYLITHTPMDSDLVRNSAYYNIMKEIGFGSVDFLMPQYYNGPLRPAHDLSSALTHYGYLVNDIYRGHASRVLFGFCINDCGGTGSNIGASQAMQIVAQVDQRYPTMGGAFFWAASADSSWSRNLEPKLTSYRAREMRSGQTSEGEGELQPDEDPPPLARQDGGQGGTRDDTWYQDSRVIMLVVGAGCAVVIVAGALVIISRRRQPRVTAIAGEASAVSMEMTEMGIQHTRLEDQL
eukprot:TRINITY_DN23777_c0_g1_i1.p1 TRINITY_DN23777_c0_g1~~TRINITY_DN23777_c0_g1_i1.p1  ORF type:complete len:568 (-),score=56.54 TRINITY_DN23777_c0_g1_i1:148-1746(-)